MSVHGPRAWLVGVVCAALALQGMITFVSELDDQVRAAAALLAVGLGSGAVWHQGVSDQSQPGWRSGAYRMFGEGGRPVRYEQGARLPGVVWYDSPHLVFVSELMVEASGYYEFTFSRLPSWPCRFVFDDGFRFPGHYRPHTPPPAAPVTDVGRPCDPHILAKVQDLVARYAARYRAVLGEAPTFGRGHTEAEIFACEARLGLRLPEDLRAVYRTVGQDPHGLLGMFCVLSLDEVLRRREQSEPHHYTWEGDLFHHDHVVMETVPAGRVRRVSHSDQWLEIATDFCGQDWAVDLDPDHQGTPGQVIEYGYFAQDPMIWIAPSVLHVLRHAVDALETHDGWQAAGTQLWPPDGIKLFPHPPSHEWGVAVGADGIAAAVARLADPSSVQQIAMLDVDQVDVAELAALTNLRSVQLWDEGRLARQVSFTLPTHQPIEALRLRAAEFNLPSIPPTVWSLTLAGNTTPVSIRPLLHNGLQRIDLAAAVVADIECLAQQPSVRVMVLNAAQWRALRDAGFEPSTLAAAALDEPTPLADAVAWWDWVQPDTAIRREVMHGHLNDPVGQPPPSPPSE